VPEKCGLQEVDAIETCGTATIIRMASAIGRCMGRSLDVGRRDETACTRLNREEQDF